MSVNFTKKLIDKLDTNFEVLYEVFVAKYCYVLYIGVYDTYMFHALTLVRHGKRMKKFGVFFVPNLYINIQGKMLKFA